MCCKESSAVFGAVQRPSTNPRYQQTRPEQSTNPALATTSARKTTAVPVLFQRRKLVLLECERNVARVHELCKRTYVCVVYIV